nr:helix-turn-helix transcriptional regulator [Streptomyces sp. SID4946]
MECEYIRDRTLEGHESARKRCESIGGAGVTDDDVPSLALHLRDQDHPRGLRELSAREREIAHLVGRGLTNKEIGKELFVSSKTVEQHLSHVYEKLALTNRRGLRDHVQRGILTQGN